MNILLDTHSLIWYIEGNKSLSKIAIDLIDDENNFVAISIVSFYEMAIKLNIGKLKLDKSLGEYFVDTEIHQIKILDINKNHLTQYLSLPLFSDHKDPFDKLIIATALSESFSIVTTDSKFELYKELVEIIF